MSQKGMLVSRNWLEKVDAKLTKTEAPASPEYQTSSRFYDVRPALLQSAWTQNAAGVYCATACFLVNDVADTSFTFTVYAPTSTDDPGGTAGTTRFFVVWRGRWELLAGAASGGGGTEYTLTTTTQSVLAPSSTTGTVLTGISISGNTLSYTTASAILSPATTTVIKTVELTEA